MAKKTKEMVIDFRQARSDRQPVDIKGSAVARVETYKYLGIVLNNKLSWGDHVDFIVKKLADLFIPTPFSASLGSILAGTF